MIVLIIKSFFSDPDSYSLGRKFHMSYFFLSFSGEMIRVVCALLAIIIEDLEMCLGNSNLLLVKSGI